VAAEIRRLIRDMSEANPLWGAPRIHGELLKLGIEVAISSARPRCDLRWVLGSHDERPRNGGSDFRARDRHGKTRMSSGGSVPPGGKVWIISSGGIKDRYAALGKVILPMTSVPELIWRWPKMLRNREQWQRQNAAASW